MRQISLPHSCKMKRIALSRIAKAFLTVLVDDSVSCFVVDRLGNVAERVGSLHVCGKRVVNHIRTDVVWIPNGQLVATCIIGHGSNFVQFVNRTQSSASCVGPCFGGIPYSVNGLGREDCE